MIIQDYVRFLMPENREYRFAAMAVLQYFVNGYDANKKNEETNELHYEIAGAWTPDDTAEWESLGLKLSYDPEPLPSAATMEIDFSDARLNRMKGSGKHVAGVCGLMCGVLCAPLPGIRRVLPRYESHKWLLEPSCADLKGLTNHQITGVIGWRSEMTYLAASMALGVVELVGPEEDEKWLSKYVNVLYRRVAGAHSNFIEQATRSVEKQIGELVCRSSERAAAAVRG